MTPDNPPRDDAQAADDVAGVAMVGQPRLSRIGLIIWLGMPILIVIGLWFMMDRSRGQPRPDMSGALGPGQRAPTGGEAPPP
jgi:hypothetical protein